ncbi:hypothetical protein [Burkholderia sp. RF4-BP95]|uniref:hypothetical protein n=1 Tax=Burkholderia sp. RF4-BP95 TaxID=1637845 RepID=UPI0012E36C33|nr:hypothetical protein [Burkholderia sp. RF4-BP95]
MPEKIGRNAYFFCVEINYLPAHRESSSITRRHGVCPVWTNAAAFRRFSGNASRSAETNFDTRIMDFDPCNGYVTQAAFNVFHKYQ